MTLSEFQDLVLAKGDKLSTWSETEQGQARALVAASPEAAAILAEAGRVREALRSQAEVKAPAGLRNRIFTAAFSASAGAQPMSPAARRERGLVSEVAARV